MDIYLAAEVAYKNGYEKGKEDSLDKLANELKFQFNDDESFFTGKDIKDTIDHFVKIFKEGEQSNARSTWVCFN